jgi:hypothetical protein
MMSTFTKFKLIPYISVSASNIKFKQNPSSGSRVKTCSQADNISCKKCTFLFRLSMIYLATLSIAQDTGRHIGGRIMNSKRFRKKRQRSNLRYYPGIRLEEPRKSMKTRKIDGLRAENSTRDLPNTKL